MPAIANDGAGGARHALFHRSCAVSNAVPFYRLIAPANRAHKRSAPRHCSVCLHGLQVMMSPPAHMSCRCLGNTWACLQNTRALLHVIVAKSFFISMAHGPQRVMGHVSVPESTSETGRGPKPMDACQRQSSRRWRGWVQCQGMCDSAGALLNGEVGSIVSGHVAAPKPS
jgi:hypothetical protein